MLELSLILLLTTSMSYFSFQPKSLRAPTQLEPSSLQTRSESFYASFDQSFDTMVGSYANPVRHVYLGRLDKESGLGTITKEDVDDLNQQGIPLEYSRVKNYTPSQLRQAALETVEDALRTSQINTTYSGTNMVGGFAPYVFDPANLFPFGRVAQVARMTGRSGAAFNKVNLAINRGQRLKAASASYGKYAKEAFLANAAVEPLYYMDARVSAQDYDATDILFNVLAGTSIGVGFFGTISAGINYRRAGRNLQNIQDFESMYSFLETGDYDQAVNVGFRDMPKFRESLEKVDILADAVQQAYDTDGIFRFDLLDAKQQKVVRKILQGYVDSGVQSSLSKVLSEQMIEEVRGNSSISVSDLSITYRERYLKVYDALLGDGDTRGFNADDLDAYNKVTNKSGVFETKIDETDFDRAQAEEGIELDAKLKERFLVLRERIKTEQHQTSGDASFKQFVEAAQTGFLTHEGKKFPVSANTLERVADIYEKNLDAFKKAPNKDSLEYVEFLGELQNTSIVRDIYTDTIGQARAKARGLKQVTSASDGQPLTQLEFNWSGKLKVGDVYENINLCRTTSGRCSFDLRMTGLPSTRISIGQLDTSGATTRMGDHNVALTEVDGKRYIVDHPQKELWEPLDPPKANAGRVISTEFKPRFIEVTPENLKNFYGIEDGGATVKKLQDAKLKEGVKEAAEMKPLKIVDELNPKEFGNLRAAQEDANIITSLLKKHKVKTLEEAVDEGHITNREKIKLLKRFEKSYKKAYSKQIELASTVINNIFGAKVDIKRAPKGSKSIAFVKSEESSTIYITRAERLLGQGFHPFSVLLHEAGHSLKNIDPDAWQQLYKIVEDNPRLKTGLEDFILNVRKYEKSKVAGEIPSVLLEWAITQKEFWRELQKRNRPLFVKLKESLRDMFTLMKRRFQKDKADAVFNDRTLRSLLSKGTTPESLARSIAEIINLSRENRLGYNKIIDATDTVRANIRRAAYTEDPAGTTNTERLLEENTPIDLDSDNRALVNLRQDTLDKTFGEMTGKSMSSLEDILLQPLDELTEGIDPDADQFISPSEFRARVREFTSEVVDEDFNRDDILLDSDYEQLYENLRNFHTNNYNKSAIAMRNNELFRTIERATADKPDTEHAGIRREVIKTYHKDAAQVIISNAIKRKSLQRQLDELKTNKEKVALLRSMLDGQERTGTPLMSGLENNMHAAGVEMVVPLLDVIYRHGMQELFMIEEGFNFFRKKGPRKYERFGRSKKERIKEFHRQLHQALLNRKLPEDMEEIEGFQELFDVVQATELKLLKKLNEAGLDVKKLQDFGGLSQKWSAELIYDMGLPAFKKRMLEVLDIRATAKAHGNVLWVEGRDKPFSINTFIDQWYESLDPARRVEDDVQVFDIENTFGGRMVRVKPEFATDVMMEFSGYDNVGYLMIQQFQRYAALAEMTKFAGTKPNEMLTGVLEGIGARGVGNKSAKATIDAMTGILWNPVDTTLAGFSNVVTKLSNILFMTGAGAASLTDVPLSASTIQVQGINFAENNRLFLQAWREATARRFGSDQKQMKDYWTGVGAGLDVLNNAVIRRVGNTELGSGMLDKGVQFVMRYNGLEPLTTIHQEMYLDVFTRGMAMELSSASPAIDLMNNLRAYGFTEAEIKRLGNSIEADPNGVERIVPNSVKSNKLREKYRQYLTKYMRQAVFMPDQGTRAQLVLGFRRGTKAGEMAYVSTQYMPFMTGQGKLLFRRFVKGNYGTGRADMIHRMAHLVAYIGGAMAFGYMAIVVKDILRGREPIGIDGLSAFDVSRIVQQSGVLGPLEVPIDIKDWGVLSALAPMPSTILGLGVDTVRGDVDGIADGVSALTGGHMLGPPQWLHGMAGDTMAQTLNEMQLDLLDESNP